MEKRSCAEGERVLSQDRESALAASEELPVSEGPEESLAPEKHRVHHSYIWLGGLQGSLAVLVAFAVALVPNLGGILADLGIAGGFGGFSASKALMGLAVAAIVFVVIVGVSLLYGAVSYKHLWYEMHDDEFSLFSGILSKRRVHVPYSRIQSVDQRASLLQRVCGVCTVSIDTAGGSANKAVTVPYVQRAEAERLRAELFARKRRAAALAEGCSPAAPGPSEAASAPGFAAPGNVLDAPADLWDDVRGVWAGEAVDTGRVTYEYGMTNKELVFTGLSNNTAFVLVLIGIVGVVSQAASVVAGIFGDAGEAVVDQAVSSSVRLFGGGLAVLGVAVVVGIAVILWAISALGSCIAYGGFHARRRDNRIEVEHGLLQHRFQGVSIDRVQSVVVRQSFIRRCLGYCELSLGKVDAVEADQSGQNGASFSQNGLVIHPFVKLDRVPEILQGLAPEFCDLPREALPVAPVALRRALIRRCIVQGAGLWLAAAMAITQALINAFLVPQDSFDEAFLYWFNVGAVAFYVACLLVEVLSAVSAVLWARGSSFAFNERFMQVSNGGLSRETTSFPRGKIQFGYTRANPFQRRAKTTTVVVRTAAGVGGTSVRLVDAREEDAAAWLAWLKPKGNVIE